MEEAVEEDTSRRDVTGEDDFVNYDDRATDSVAVEAGTIIYYRLANSLDAVEDAPPPEDRSIPEIEVLPEIPSEIEAPIYDSSEGMEPAPVSMEVPVPEDQIQDTASVSQELPAVTEQADICTSLISYI